MYLDFVSREWHQRLINKSNNEDRLFYITSVIQQTITSST